MAGLEEITKSRLSALILMSKNNHSGINYLEFVKQGSHMGAIDLIDKGYAVKVIDKNDEDEVNYRLTEKGVNYLANLIKFAEKGFR